MTRFVQLFLKPALQAAGLTTLVFAGEASWRDSSDLVTAPITTAPGSYDGYAYHGYFGSPTVAVSNGAVATGKPVLMTEMSTGTLEIGASATTQFDFYGTTLGPLAINNGHAGHIFWNWMLDQQSKPYRGDRGTIGGAVDPYLHGVITVQNDTGVVTKNSDYYFIRHIANFVKPGSQVITSRQTATNAMVQSCAFHNADGSTTVFLYNSSANPVSATITDTVGMKGTTVTLASREFNTVTFPDQAAGTAAAPSSVTITSEPLNAMNRITVDAWANGAAVTSFDIYRGTSAGAESATPLATITTGSTDPFGALTKIFDDTTAVNGTTYFYTATARSTAGSSASNETSSTPDAAIPNHYMAIPSVSFGHSGNVGAASPASASNNVPNDYLDITAYVRLDSYTTTTGTQSLVGNFASIATTNANTSFMFGISSGKLSLWIYQRTANVRNIMLSSAAVSTANPSATKGIYLRAVANCQAVAVNGFAAGTVTFFTSPDGSTWTQLGTAQAAAQNGIARPGGTGGAAGLMVGDNFNVQSTNPNTTGRFYKVIAKDETGAILFNPDFTAQTAGAASFADTAPTPRTWTFQFGASEV